MVFAAEEGLSKSGKHPILIYRSTDEPEMCFKFSPKRTNQFDSITHIIALDAIKQKMLANLYTCSLFELTTTTANSCLIRKSFCTNALSWALRLIKKSFKDNKDSNCVLLLWMKLLHVRFSSDSYSSQLFTVSRQKSPAINLKDDHP
jgi:hypothetical protein